MPIAIPIVALLLVGYISYQNTTRFIQGISNLKIETES